MWQRVLYAGLAVALLFALAACLPAAAPTAAPTTVAAVTNTPVPATTAAPRSTDAPATAPAPTLAVTQAPALTLTPTSARTVAAALTTGPTPTPAPTRTDSVAPSSRPITPPTAAPAATPAPTGAVPTVIRFTVLPQAPLTVGSELTMNWEAVGEQASLCFIDAAGPTGCQDVPLTGSRTVAVTDETLWHVGVGLRASGGGTFTFSTVNLRFECPDRQWFFPNHPSRCAERAAIASHAAAQYFEHGFMIWTEQPDRFYVFFDKDPASGWQEYVWWQAPYAFGTPQPPNGTPPAGYQEPVSGFGRVWRGELTWGSVDVRARLGWATAPELAFDTVYQCAMSSHPKLWQCYLRGPDGAVLYLHPDSSAQVRFLWERQ